jgi:Flp pilus assembly protein TadD
MAKAWVGLLVGATAVLLAGQALAKTDRLVSREEALALLRPSWGHSGSGQYLAGQFAQRNLDFGSAAELLDGALSWAPNNLELRERVFLLMLAEGRLVDAVPHVRALHRHDPNDMLPSVVDAVDRMFHGDGIAAVTALTDLNSGGFPGLVRMLGQAWAFVAVDDLPAARAVLAFSAKVPAWAAIVAIHSALIEDVAKTDRVGEAYASMAEQKAARAGRTAGLIANFEARKGDPSIQPLVRNAQDGFAEALFSIAAALNQGDRTLSALVYGQLCLALRPDSDLFRMLVAEVLEKQKRYAAAAEMYGTIERNSPNFAVARLAQARDLARADMAEDAISALQSLGSAGADTIDGLILLGDIFRGEQRFAEAVVVYDKAAAKLGKIGADYWRLLYSRGIALERTGQWARAERDLQAALQIKPDEAFVLNYLGYSWIDRGENLEKAESMVRRAAELRPEDGFIADSLGWAYYRAGRYADAVKELERAITLQPVDPVINEHLGDAYWQAGRKVEARFQWRRALNFKPAAEAIPALEEKLQCGVERCAVAQKAN